MNYNFTNDYNLMTEHSDMSGLSVPALSRWLWRLLPPALLLSGLWLTTPTSSPSDAPLHFPPLPASLSAEARTLARTLTRAHVVEWHQLSAAPANTTPDPQTLNEFWHQQATQYQLPEQRQYTYLLFNQDNLQAHHQKSTQAFSDSKVIWIKQLHDQLTQGMTLNELARHWQLPLEHSDWISLQGGNHLFANPDLRQQLFSLSTETPQLLFSPDSWLVIQLSGSQPARQMRQAEAIPLLMQHWQSHHQQQQLIQQSEQLKTALTHQAPINSHDSQFTPATTIRADSTDLPPEWLHAISLAPLQEWRSLIIQDQAYVFRVLAHQEQPNDLALRLPELQRLIHRYWHEWEHAYTTH